MRYLSLTLGSLLLVAPACSSKTSGGETDGSGEGESSTDTQTSESGSESQSTSDASSGDGDGDTGDGDGDSGDGDGDTGEPNCGDNTCDATQFCDWDGNFCGTRSWEEGTCEPRPDGCDDFYDPKCGCDGQVYGNECEAHGAGVDIDENGQCTPPDGYFPCGPGYCQLGSSYCLLQVSDVGGEPNGYTCEALPAECTGNGDCDCLANVVCGDMCSATGEGFMVTCPGG